LNRDYYFYCLLLFAFLYNYYCFTNIITIGIIIIFIIIIFIIIIITIIIINNNNDILL
jgi:hypothetical protein